MPDFPGVIVSAPLGGAAAADMHPLWDAGRSDIYDPRTEVALATVRIRVIASAHPSPEAFAPMPGRTSGGFSDDYYYRIYLQRTRIDFGNLVVPTTRMVEIWNAYPEAVTIFQLDGDTEGLALGFAPLARMRGLEDIFYAVTTTLDGPSFVDTLLTLHFSQGGTRTLAVAYGRVLVMGLRHDWAGGFTERLEWLTDVLVLRDGGEQRVRLRAEPRRSYGFGVLEYGSGGQLDLLLCVWQARVYAVPVWTDKARLATAIYPGDTVLAVDTTDPDYPAGGSPSSATSSASDRQVVGMAPVD